MLRFLGSLSPSAFSTLRKVCSPLNAAPSTAQRNFCSQQTSEPSAPVLLFKTGGPVVNLYRLIGLSVYTQVAASLFYVQQMLFPSTPSKYSWGVQAAFAGGLVSMSCTIPIVYFFAIRRNIFQVSILKNERQLLLKHLGKNLSLVETKVSLDDIEPIARLSKNLRMLIHQRSTNTLDTFYLERQGKYLDRNLLEEIAKGVHSKPISTSSAQVGANAPSAASVNPTPSKYAVRPKKIIKDTNSASEQPPTTSL